MTVKFADNQDGLVAKLYRDDDYTPTDEEKMAMLPALSPVQLECLEQLISPVWDGNLISKATRSELVDMKLVSRYAGLNFCTQDGYAVLEILGQLKDNDKFIGGKPWKTYKGKA